jgi:NADH-quinone oxidoreductase subunit J
VTPLLATSAGDVVVWIVWMVAAASCLASAVAVVSFTHPFYSALALIGNLASLAVLYLLLSASFVAAAQVLVYAGAIVVMFLFVIAYLGGEADAPWRGGPSIHTLAAGVAAGAILVEVLVVIGVQAGGSGTSTPSQITGAFGSPAAIGELFLTDHLLAFEVTSVVLLVAAVGGVILGSHARRFDEEGSS